MATEQKSFSIFQFENQKSPSLNFQQNENSKSLYNINFVEDKPNSVIFPQLKSVDKQIKKAEMSKIIEFAAQNNNIHKLEWYLNNPSKQDNLESVTHYNNFPKLFCEFLDTRAILTENNSGKCYMFLPQNIYKLMVEVGPMLLRASTIPQVLKEIQDFTNYEFAMNKKMEIRNSDDLAYFLIKWGEFLIEELEEEMITNSKKKLYDSINNVMKKQDNVIEKEDEMTDLKTINGFYKFLEFIGSHLLINEIQHKLLENTVMPIITGKSDRRINEIKMLYNECKPENKAFYNMVCDWVQSIILIEK
jgi:hypothetical protein